MVDELRELYDYNTWANGRIFDAASKLSTEQFNQTVPGSFPSVRETLRHILAAEWIWLSRWKGESPSAIPAEWDTSTMEGIRSHWEENTKNLITFVRGLSASDVQRSVTYRSIKGDSFTNTMSQILRHLVNHSTYHRGQIVNMLRNLGSGGVGTDMIIYFREQQKN